MYSSVKDSVFILTIRIIFIDLSGKLLGTLIFWRNHQIKYHYTHPVEYQVRREKKNNFWVPILLGETKSGEQHLRLQFPDLNLIATSSSLPRALTNGDRVDRGPLKYLIIYGKFCLASCKVDTK